MIPVCEREIVEKFLKLPVHFLFHSLRCHFLRMGSRQEEVHEEVAF